MKKNSTGWALVVVFLMMFCFSSATCLAGEVKLSEKENAEIAKTLRAVRGYFGDNVSLDKLSNAELIAFGIHVSKFAPKEFLPNGHYLVPAKIVQDTVNKYFNVPVKHESVAGYLYENGHYEFGGSNIPESNYVVIDKIDKKNKEAFMVIASSLSWDEGQPILKHKAFLKKVGSGNKARYTVQVFNSMQP